MKIFFRNFKKGLMLGAVVLVASLVAWFGYNQWNLSALRGPQSHLAVGVLKEVNSEQLIILGNHVADNYPNIIDYSQRQDFIIVVRPDTKFSKLVWSIPVSLEALNKDRVKLNPAEIKKEKLTGSIDELRNLKGASVKIKTEENTVKKTTFEAMEVEYVVYVYAK